MIIDLTSLAVAITGGVFSTMAVVIPIWLRERMNDKAAADTLGTAIKNSLGAIQQAATSEIVALRPQIPGVPAALVPGVQYVLDNAGPEAERLGVTPDKIAAKVEAQIGLSSIATNLALTASPAPIVVPPLDPVPSSVPQPPSPVYVLPPAAAGPLPAHG